VAALVIISVLSIGASLSAHASRHWPDRSRSVPTKVNEQGYFPLCSLPSERLLPVNLDGLALIKICT